MVSVDEATRIVISHPFRPTVGIVDVRSAVGRVLAEQVFADRDVPPFNRVAMDGIAIGFSAWNAGHRIFPVEAVHAAGEPTKSLRSDRNCFEVMTGAVLPNGTDTVIRYEDIEVKDGKAFVADVPVTQGQNVHVQGIDAKASSILLEPPMRLSPAEIALLASVGKTFVAVYQYPSTAIISSGDELVDIDKTPAPHEIRKSNTYALEAAMKEFGWSSHMIHLPDKRDVLEKELENIFKSHDVLILSGGVSKGKFDYIPSVMESLGIEKRFHQVQQRPGKPFWFGTNEEKTVFALPGNPVSTYMCFYRFVLPWLFKSFGIDVRPMSAILSKPFKFEPPVTYFLQVNASCEDGKLIATPIAGGGSGDFANLKNITGFLELPASKNQFEAGSVYPYYPFRAVK